jgi:TusA-related sulfurtransferase
LGDTILKNFINGSKIYNFIRGDYLTIDHTLDVRGRPCPVPIIMVKKKLAKIKTGETIEITADSLVVKENIERYLDDNKINVDIQENKGIFKLIIKK